MSTEPATAVSPPPADTTTVMILAKQIDWLKRDPKKRSFDKDFLGGLAQSIKVDGLLNPVTIRPNPASPGRYIGVAGEHRWFATHKILKYDLIECKVIEATDAQAAIRTVAENLFRNPLTSNQRTLAIKLWHDAHFEETVRFEAEKKERETKKLEAKIARANKDAGPKTGDQVQVGPEPEAVADEPEPVAPPTNFARDVATKIGTSETSVKRSLAIANAFDEDQLEILEQMGVAQLWTETISKIKDKDQRDKIVALIASGKPPKDSIAAVTGESEIRQANGDVKPAADASEDSNLPDSEWVDFHCSDVLATLPHKDPFRADAILYRQSSSLRATFKAKTKPILADAKKAGAVSGLYGVLYKLAEMSHPKHWIRCGKCAGNGVAAGETVRCSRCFGGGYLTTKEATK